jgi:hypothetical protein
MGRNAETAGGNGASSMRRQTKPPSKSGADSIQVRAATAVGKGPTVGCLSGRTRLGKVTYQKSGE